MRSFLPLLVFLGVITVESPAQSIVRFKVSRPYAVFSFMEAASGTAPHSVTYEHYLDTAITAKDTLFANMLDAFRDLQLSYNYRRDEYPSNRRQSRSTYDLIIIAAVKSVTLNDFSTNTIGILPNSTHEQLFRLLKKAEPYYEKMVWKQSAAAMKERIAGFNKYIPAANELFRSFRTFYGSSWPDDLPFDVTIFPIPLRNGNTTATPHANSLCVSVLTGRSDYSGTMGVTMHELCHVLYDEQPAALQHQLDEVFTGSKSPFARIAYSFFDEALATALGNGWAYKRFSGRIDTTEWYNNEYIDGFAHAIYPLVSEYLLASKPMDSVFVVKAIELFGKTYPRSASDYSILLNNMYLYSDAEKQTERGKLKKVVGRYFQSSRYNFSSPILHEYSLGYLKQSSGAQLVVVDRDQDSTITALKKVLPELESLLKDQTGKNYIVTFYDKTRRPVIVIRVENEVMLDKAFRLLKAKRYMDEDQPVMAVE